MASSSSSSSSSLPAPATPVARPSGQTTSFPGVLLPVDDVPSSEEEACLVPWVTELPPPTDDYPLESISRTWDEMEAWMAKRVQDDIAEFEQAGEDFIYEQLGDKFAHFFHIRVAAADFLPFQCRLCGYDARCPQEKKSRMKIRGHLGLAAARGKRCPHVEEEVAEKPGPKKKQKTE